MRNPSTIDNKRRGFKRMLLCATCFSFGCHTAAMAQAATNSPPTAQAAPVPSQPTPAEAAPAPVAGHAEQRTAGVQDIIVTARKRAENVQNVPLAITAVSGATLEHNQIRTIVDLQQTVPSLNYTPTGLSRLSQVNIRGIGTDSSNGGVDSAVGVYVDGIYIPVTATALAAEFPDLEAVEVLRGPQGTLFGRNTPVGAISIRSRAPQMEPEAMITGGIGNYETRYVSGYVGGGIAENLAGRVGFYTDTHGGYDYNYFNDRPINDGAKYGVRSRITWKPDATLTVDLNGFFNKQHNNCCAGDDINPTGPGGVLTLYPNFSAAIQQAIGRPFLNVTGGDHKVDQAFPPLENDILAGSSLTVNKGLGNFQLTSLSAWVHLFNDSFTASDAKPIYARSLEYHTVRDAYSEELRLSSPADRPVNYVLGLYGYTENQHFFQHTLVLSGTNRLTAAGPLVPGDQNYTYFQQRNNALAAFGTLNWDLAPRLHFTAGGRMSYDYKSGRNYSPAAVNKYTGAPTSASLVLAGQTIYDTGNLKVSSWTPSGSASLRFDVTPTVNIYGNVATGYQAAGFSGFRVVSGTPTTFGKENTVNFELGSKMTLFDRMLRFNVDLYRLNVNGFQTSIKDALTNQFFVTNAGNRRAQGVEFDGQFVPTRAFSLAFSGAYLDAKYTKFDNAPCAPVAFRVPQVTAGTLPGTCSYAGVKPHLSPTWTLSATPEIRTPVNDRVDFFIGATGSYTSGYYTDPTEDVRGYQNGYVVVNARMGVEGAQGKWRVNLWVKNATDKAYLVQSTAFTATYIAAAPAPSTLAPTGAQNGYYSAPRTFGIEGSVKF